jgi:hypothetical protein
MNLIDLGALIGMRERSENLDMNELALTDLNLDEEVGASDNLGSDGDWVEVCEFLSCLLLDVMSKVSDHSVLLLGQTRALIPST